jgi:hypothetical protein
MSSWLMKPSLLTKRKGLGIDMRDKIAAAMAMHEGRKSGTVLKVAALQEEREVRCELESLPEQVMQEADTVIIEQTQLDKNPTGYVRVRKETIKGKGRSISNHVEYTFTSKDFSKNLEDTIPISEDLFGRLYALGTSPQTKTRYKWKGWDIDCMSDGRVVAEFEMVPGQDRVKVPAVLKVKAVLSPTIQVGDELTKKLPVKNK